MSEIVVSFASTHSEGYFSDPVPLQFGMQFISM